MNDFRLQVFISVAETLSFTRASEKLYISQPAISKHIRELEASYGVQLFERTRSSVKLTEEGNRFYVYAIDICDKYKELEFEMSLYNKKVKGELKIGASSTISQYILPKILSHFMNDYPDIRINLFNGNTQQIEKMLQDHRIDLGMIEGRNGISEFNCEKFQNDEIVLVRKTRLQDEDFSANVSSVDNISIDELKNLKLVLREDGSGTLNVINTALAEVGVELTDLNILTNLGSTESIKHFLMETPDTYGLISIAALHSELMHNELQVVDVDGLSIDRELLFISLTGKRSRLSDKFKIYAKSELF
ncbi:MAG: LysR substrate-binding domain-containing protein [Bacteroidales bacterium]